MAVWVFGVSVFRTNLTHRLLESFDYRKKLKNISQPDIYIVVQICNMHSGWNKTVINQPDYTDN